MKSLASKMKISIFAVLMSSLAMAADTPTVKCTVTPGSYEICASPEFVHQYNDYKKLAAKINKQQQSRAMKRLLAMEDELNGAGMRVGKGIPQNYALDETTMKFIPKAPPAPPAPKETKPEPTPETK